jgi:hypothetical protein
MGLPASDLAPHGPTVVAMTFDDCSVVFTAETLEPVPRARVAEALESASWYTPPARRLEDRLPDCRM